MVTNCHVLEGGVQFSVVSGRTTHTGTLRVADHDRDLCELQMSMLNAPRVRLVNRPRRAIVAYNQALKLDGDSYEAWLGAGVTYLALNQYDRAVEASLEALRLRANDLPALVQLGTAYHHQNQRARMRGVHTRIEKLDGRAARDFAG